jgi:RNA polymerase sigma-70 factor (ECF subfamily)
METATDPDGRLAAAFYADRALLFALCYRLLGTAADAEEIVQETFARALERPPPDTDRPWRPWLVRVAVRLCLDSLRRRRRRSYPGPWLPGVVATGDEEPAPPSETPEQRYGLRESATVAFLLALEALRPAQRAVLILCDAFGYSAREASEAIDTSEGNARVLLHRARKALDAYDRARCRPTRELAERTRRSLEAFLGCLAAHDVAGVERLLAADVRALTDGGGDFAALPAAISGRAQVARLALRVARRRAPGARIALGLVNGLPAAAIEYARSVGRQAPRVLLRCELDAAGAIRELHWIAASRKLAAVRSLFPAPPPEPTS